MTTTTATLDRADARLHYEVRGAGPLIALIGSPMDADAFAPLADELASDHTVLTADPRGIRRSSATDPTQDSGPALRAADLAALIEHVGQGPATAFGSSGGAVTVLALAEQRPEIVDIVIAHEPPLLHLLPDSAEQLQTADALIALALGGDRLAAWRMFFTQAGIEMPEEILAQWFGGDADPQQLADERFWFAHEYRGSVSWRPDIEALRGADVRFVLGIGEESAGQLCERTATALGALLGVEPTRFPGDHTGFVDRPTEFAARLRAVLVGR